MPAAYHEHVNLSISVRQRERTDDRSLPDRCSARDDCARVLTARRIGKGRKTDGGDRNTHEYLLECFAGVSLLANGLTVHGVDSSVRIGHTCLQADVPDERAAATRIANREAAP